MKRATSELIKIRSESQISIHALMKRATAWFYDYRKIYAISIHALMKRATVSPATATLSKGDFNPRPHEEGDYLSPVK